MDTSIKRFTRAMAHGRGMLAQHVLAVTFCVCACGVTFLGGLAFFLFDRAQQSDARLLQTAVTVAKLERLHLTIVEAESAGRAYLVSGNPIFKSSFHETLWKLDAELRQFKERTEGNTAQQSLVADLEQHIARRFAYLEALLGLRAAKGIDAVLRTTIGPGVQEMQLIKGLIAQMKETESRLLNDRRETQRRRDEQLQFGLALLITVGLAVLGVLFWYMKHLWIARQRAEARALHDAHHDALTGLPNRRLLHDRLAIALARAARENTQLALLSMDLDGFKHVNDTYGHDAGDELLRNVSARLAKLVRTEDTVARMGGDEFTIALTPVRDSDEVRAIAERIVDSVSVPFLIGEHAVTIGASVGVALYPRDGVAEEDLMQRADLALYAAKKGNRPARAAQPMVPGAPANRAHRLPSAVIGSV